MKKQVTIKDVARRAGASVGTVSNLLNGLPCGAELREKINSAIRELHYVPNMHAKAVRSSRTNCIGLLVEGDAEDNYPWLQSEIAEFIAVAAESGYRAMLEYWDNSSEKLPQLLNCVDGLITRGHFTEKFCRILEQNGNIPLVTHAEPLFYANELNVLSNSLPGMSEALEYLLGLGHRNIGYVGDLSTPFLAVKAENFLSAWKNKGFDYDRAFMENTRSYEGTPADAGFAATEALLARKGHLLTALLYDSDCHAIGGLGALQKCRKSIPADCSVISFDDSTWASSVRPALTSIAPDVSLMSLEVHCLIRKLKAEDPSSAPFEAPPCVPYRLVIRESTASPPPFPDGPDESPSPQGSVPAGTTRNVQKKQP